MVAQVSTSKNAEATRAISTILYFKAMPRFTRKESIEAFLPERIVALSHVVEMIGEMAMTLEEQAVEAARHGDFRRLEDWTEHADCDAVSLVGAVKPEETEILGAIRLYLPCDRILEAVEECGRLDVTKLLYRLCEQNGSCRRCLVRLLSSGAVKGNMGVLQFGIEKTAEHLLAAYTSSRHLSNAVAVHRSIIRNYMSRDSNLQRWFGQAFHDATLNGHEHVADVIYQCFPYSERVKLFELMVQKDNAGAVRYCFRKDNVRQFSNRRKLLHLGVMFRTFNIAVQNSRCNVLPLLMKWGSFSSEVLVSAFTRAFRRRSYDVATVLYKTKRISRSFLENWLENTQSVDEIWVLLNMERFSTDVLARIIDSASAACVKFRNRAHARIIEFLLIKIDDVPNESVERAFVTAVNSNCDLLLRALWLRSLISTSVRSRLFKYLCATSQMDKIKLLCNCGFISPTLAAEMLVSAIHNDNILVAKYLWGQACIPRKIYTEEFLAAAAIGDVKVVKWFCLHQVSLKSITKAFVVGVDAGHVGVARCLYDKQRASPAVMNDLIERARSMQNLGVLAFLLQVDDSRREYN